MLLFVGKTKNVEMPPIVETGKLSQRSYMIQLNDQSGSDSFNLQIIPTPPLPEPVGLSILIFGTSLAALRRRH